MERKEAIETIRRCCPRVGDSQCAFETALRELVPELAEGEDERIRKEIINFIQNGQPEHLYDKRWIAYLEKQKEKKPVETQDYSDLTDFERVIHRGFLAAGVENVPVTIIKETAKESLDVVINREAKGLLLNGFISFEEYLKIADVPYADKILQERKARQEEKVKPAEWSEEDENMRWNVISIVGQSKSVQAEEMMDWLKSLRPSWKPSREQMDSLRDTIVQTKGYSYSTFLPELYEDLKKL